MHSAHAHIHIHIHDSRRDDGATRRAEELIAPEVAHAIRVMGGGRVAVAMMTARLQRPGSTVACD